MLLNASGRPLFIKASLTPLIIYFIIVYQSHLLINITFTVPLSGFRDEHCPRFINCIVCYKTHYCFTNPSIEIAKCKDC